MMRILIVVTNHDTLGESGKPTGLWLPELTHFYDVVQTAGFAIDLASPAGGSIPIDPASRSSKDTVSRDLFNDITFVESIEDTLPISKIDPKKYAALYFPGGHGPMWDLANDQTTARITRDIYEQGGVVSAACHGPAALLPVKLSDGTHLLAEHTVTGFTNLEEHISMKKKWMPFSLENELKRLAKKYTKGFPWLPHCEISDRLITGQNPASAKPVAAAVISKLT